MRHPTEGVLRRLLDEPAGVADSDRQHVAGCPQCLGELAAIREDAALVDAALATEGAADVDVAAAWRRLSTAAPAAGTGAGGGSRPVPVGPARSCAVPLVAALAVAVVLAGAGTAAANDWLQIFRTEQIAPVSISTADLVALPDLSAYGELAVTGDAGRARGRRRGGGGSGDRSRRAGGDHPAPRGQRRAGVPGGRRGERHVHLLGGARRPGRRRGRGDAAASPARAGRELGAAGRRPGRGCRSGRPPPGRPPWSSVAPWRRRRSPPASRSRRCATTCCRCPACPTTSPRSCARSPRTAPPCRCPCPPTRSRPRRRRWTACPATVLETRDRTLAAVVWVDDGVVTAVAGSLDADEVLSVAREPAVSVAADAHRRRDDAARRAAADLVAGLPPAPAVWCSGLRKRYGRQQAVEDVSLEVGRGEVVGLLGPNGAGKTSVIKMLLGLVHPDAGEVMLLGRPGGRSGRARPRRLPAGALPVPAVAERGRGAGPARPAVGGRRDRGGAARLPGPRRPGRPRRRPGGRLLEGDAAAPRAGGRSGGPAGAGRPGRADQRAGPARARRRARHRAGAEGRGASRCCSTRT